MSKTFLFSSSQNTRLANFYFFEIFQNFSIFFELQFQAHLSENRPTFLRTHFWTVRPTSWMYRPTCELSRPLVEYTDYRPTFELSDPVVECTDLAHLPPQKYTVFFSVSDNFKILQNFVGPGCQHPENPEKKTLVTHVLIFWGRGKFIHRYITPPPPPKNVFFFVSDEK